MQLEDFKFQELIRQETGLGQCSTTSQIKIYHVTQFYLKSYIVKDININYNNKIKLQVFIIFSSIES